MLIILVVLVLISVHITKLIRTLHDLRIGKSLCVYIYLFIYLVSYLFIYLIYLFVYLY